MKNKKIVLTGGACGGKSESIPLFKEGLINEGYSVNVLEETANSLLSMGFSPKSNISVFDFQHLLFNIQFLREYYLEGQSNILICDRGLLDGKVYLGSDSFNRILELNNLDEQTIKSTYDRAIYFKSIVHDYPELFREKRPYDDIDATIRRDLLCKDIWLDKIIDCEYSNLEGFSRKQELLYSSLMREIKLLQEESSSLSDYYDIEYLKFIRKGIDTILNSNDISQDIKIKTKGLVE